MSLSELMQDLQASVQTVVNLEGKLKDEKLINALKNVLKTAKIGVTEETGKALHRLDESKPSIDTVKELIQGIPDAMSCTNGSYLLPIQLAVLASVKYVPILAKEGTRHNVGGRGMRGGLLVEFPELVGDISNTLQLISHAGYPSDPIPFDTDFLDVIKELRKDNLFLKKDIKEHKLLYCSIHPNAKLRFEYLADWDPDCLMTCTYDDDMSLSHALFLHKTGYYATGIEKFTIFLQNSLKHYPQYLGFLFQEDSEWKTAYERAVDKFGFDETFKVIQELIPTDTSLPILHRVMKYSPRCFNDFSTRYPSALYLRDENARSFIQAQLAEGKKSFASDAYFFLRLSDDEIAEVDPVTKQYPFLTAATGQWGGNLSTTYFLLSKNPSLLERYREEATQQAMEEQEAEMRKRERDGDDDDEEKEEEE